jgi:hypothetical protein
MNVRNHGLALFNNPALGDLQNLGLNPLDREINKQLNKIEILIQQYVEKKINLISLRSESSKIRANIRRLNQGIDTLIDTKAKKLSEKVSTSINSSSKSNSFGSAYQINPKSSHLEASSIRKKLHDATDKLENYLFEIAKIEANRFGGSISREIQNYGIKDPQKLFELAKIAVTKNAIMASKYIQNYGIKDQQQLLQIAKIAISKIFNDYKIRNLSPRSLIEYLQHYPREIYLEYPNFYLLTDREITADEIRGYAGKGPFPKGLESIIDSICNQKDTFVRKPLTELLGMFLLKCHIDSIPKSDIERVMPIIQELFNFREPGYRMTLLSSAFILLRKPKSIDAWRTLFDATMGKEAADQKEKRKPFTALISMLLAPFIPPELLEPISQVISKHYFKDTAKRNPLIKSLQTITEPYYFEEDNEKQRIILNFVFGTPPFIKESVLKNAKKVSNLLVFGEIESLSAQDPALGLDPLINNLLKEQMGLDGVENCADKFWSTFGSFRRPDALINYAAILGGIRDAVERDQNITCLRKFVRSVLEGTFRALRYSNTPHLNKVFGGPLGKELKDEWVKGARYLDAFEPKAIIGQRQGNAFNPRSFFETKILLEKRLPHHDYGDVVSVLQNPEKAETVKKSLRERLAEKESPANTITKKKDNFQLQLINLIHSSPALDSQELFEKMENLLKRFDKIYLNRAEQPPELIKDLKEIVESLRSLKGGRQSSQYAGWEVVDTDDPCDLLLLGTEVAGSCQHINGDPKLNKCLLSYLLDGKNRAIVVKNKSGNIVARAILRILWDNVKKKPVLFQEKTYPHTLDPLVELALNDSFKRRARELGLPLLSDNPTDSYYPNEIHSLGGVAPSEYVDAGGKGIVQGPWSLSHMYLVRDVRKRSQSLEIP